MTPPAAKKHDPVDFDSAVHAVMLERLEGRISASESQTNQSIQNMNGTLQAMQADVQRIDARSVENNAVLHELRERSTGLERLARAVEAGGLMHAGETTKVSNELAHMRGFIRGVVLCGALGFGSLGMFVVYRMDKTDEGLAQLKTLMNFYHPASGARP